VKFDVVFKSDIIEVEVWDKNIIQAQAIIRKFGAENTIVRLLCGNFKHKVLRCGMETQVRRRKQEENQHETQDRNH
jgi:hypothetical protein